MWPQATLYRYRVCPKSSHNFFYKSLIQYQFTIFLELSKVFSPCFDAPLQTLHPIIEGALEAVNRNRIPQLLLRRPMQSSFQGSFDPWEQKEHRWCKIGAAWWLGQRCHTYFGQQLGASECGVAWCIVMVQDPIEANSFWTCRTLLHDRFSTSHQNSLLNVFPCSTNSL